MMRINSSRFCYKSNNAKHSKYSGNLNTVLIGTCEILRLTKSHLCCCVGVTTASALNWSIKTEFLNDIKYTLICMPVNIFYVTNLIKNRVGKYSSE